MRRPSMQTIGYASLLLGCFILAMTAWMTPLGTQVDNDAYDWMVRLRPPQPWEPQSALLTIDEQTLIEMGGMRNLRGMLAEGLEHLIAASPAVVAIDAILADVGEPSQDALLESAFAKTPRLLLSSDLMPEGQGWEEPLPRFARSAVAVGHVHADPDRYDGVSRQIPLEKADGRTRRWALSLEAFRLKLGAERILESPEDIEVGGVRIPAPRSEGRPMLIRYLPLDAEGASRLPRVSLQELRTQPELAARFAGKVVFVGVTAQSAMRDRLMTPYSYGRTMPGVEIHANAFETMAQNRFLQHASGREVVLFCVLLTLGAGLTFFFRTGWQAYGVGALLLAAALLVPFLRYTQDTLHPYSAPVLAAWLSVVGAAAFQYFAVRRQLRKAESDKDRYQQAMHYVTHEMRTPLTAIQGSSELMSRYALNEEKNKQIAALIHSESKRLGRMIETFLNVERLSAGQIALKRETFQAGELMAACVERVRPLADRKQIRLEMGPMKDADLVGDRELIEYAFYNLLTNAVKYSPAGREVAVGGHRDNASLRIFVRDQGIGMDEKEVRDIFKKFYRTKKAEASGETGTGVGLSIVDQIVTFHGGRIEVTSAPEKGSCFTVVMPMPVSATASELK